MNSKELVIYLHKKQFGAENVDPDSFAEIGGDGFLDALQRALYGVGYEIALVPIKTRHNPYEFRYWVGDRGWREGEDAGSCCPGRNLGTWDRVIEKDEGLKCSPKTALLRLGIETCPPEFFNMDERAFSKAFRAKRDLAIRDICDFAEALGYRLVLVRSDCRVGEDEFELSMRPLGEDTASRVAFPRLSSKASIVGGCTIDMALEILMKAMDINRVDLARGSRLLPAQVGYLLRGGVTHGFAMVEDALVALGYKLMLVPEDKDDFRGDVIGINYRVSEMQVLGTLDGVTGGGDVWDV